MNLFDYSGKNADREWWPRNGDDLSQLSQLDNVTLLLCRDPFWELICLLIRLSSELRGLTDYLQTLWYKVELLASSILC